jgi:two-component system LytT family sensor kinase
MKDANLTRREGGVGLENVHKRLQMLYPNRYHLQSEQSNGIYKLKLQLDL